MQVLSCRLSDMLACHAAMLSAVMVMDWPSETASQTLIKYFLVYVASVMVSLHNSRKVTRISVIPRTQSNLLRDYAIACQLQP